MSAFFAAISDTGGGSGSFYLERQHCHFLGSFFLFKVKEMVLLIFATRHLLGAPGLLSSAKGVLGMLSTFTE